MDVIDFGKKFMQRRIDTIRQGANKGEEIGGAVGRNVGNATKWIAPFVNPTTVEFAGKVYGRCQGAQTGLVVGAFQDAKRSFQSIFH